MNAWRVDNAENDSPIVFVDPTSAKSGRGNKESSKKGRITTKTCVRRLEKHNLLQPGGCVTALAALSVRIPSLQRSASSVQDYFLPLTRPTRHSSSTSCHSLNRVTPHQFFYFFFLRSFINQDDAPLLPSLLDS